MCFASISDIIHHVANTSSFPTCVARRRNRVLSLLGIETVSDTKHRTELRRMRQKQEGSVKGGRSWNIFGRKDGSNGENREGGGAGGGGGKASSITKKKKDHYFNFREANSMAIRILRVAQELGVVGAGIATGDESWDGFEDDVQLFNEVMEFSWPPESRLIEQDCTCEFWNRIKYKY